MASEKNTEKRNDKRPISLFIVIGIMAIVLGFGIKYAYAFYHISEYSGLLANQVGDFDVGDGDINILIYRETDEGEFARVHTIPSAYYMWDQSATTCSIACSNGETGDCRYSYDATNKYFTITSNKKVTCKFYFVKEADSDINLTILAEDENGSYTHTGTDGVERTYSLMEAVPAYGYEYSEEFSCSANNANTNITYNPETRKFTISTSQKDDCYVYFNSVGNSDIKVNVYIQSTEGSTEYTQVDSIPSYRTYKLNSTLSKCTSPSGTVLSTPITYSGGYINITATEQQTCNVYLDISEEEE